MNATATAAPNDKNVSEYPKLLLSPAANPLNEAPMPWAVTTGPGYSVPCLRMMSANHERRERTGNPGAAPLRLSR